MEGRDNRQGKVEKMGYETPYIIYVHCRVCWAGMWVGPRDLMKVCPDCNPDQWEKPREEIS